MGFPGGSDSKESTCNAGDHGSIPGLGRSPGEANGYPLQYSCLEKSMYRGSWKATVRGVTKSRTHLNDFQISALVSLVRLVASHFGNLFTNTFEDLPWVKKFFNYDAWFSL